MTKKKDQNVVDRRVDPKKPAVEESKTKQVYSSLEKYIPAPIIATFISINTFVPQGGLDSFIPSLDRWIMIFVASIFGVIMYVYLNWSRTYSRKAIRILISISVTCWCLMVAEQRFAGLQWWILVSIISFIYIVVLLLVLTLFEVRRD